MNELEEIAYGTNGLLTQILENEIANSNLLAIIASEAERTNELLVKILDHLTVEPQEDWMDRTAEIVSRQEPKP